MKPHPQATNASRRRFPSATLPQHFVSPPPSSRNPGHRPSKWSRREPQGLPWQCPAQDPHKHVIVTQQARNHQNDTRSIETVKPREEGVWELEPAPSWRASFTALFRNVAFIKPDSLPFTCLTIFLAACFTAFLKAAMATFFPACIVR